MYPSPFSYHRATSVAEAIEMLQDLDGDVQLLAGGQSLIPLLKLRMSSPDALVDINFVDGLSYMSEENGILRIGALTRHNDVARSSTVADIAPILVDCAAGIADDQVRNRGTVGGSVAEADPSGDWAPVLFTLETELQCEGPNGERVIPLNEFFADAFSTVLEHGELIKEVTVKAPPKNSGGAYVAFKRSAPVYATASVAARVSMEGDVCKSARIALGSVGLTTIVADEAASELEGEPLNEDALEKAAEAAKAAAEPQPDQRGSAEYKRDLVGTLTKRALNFAHRRSQGEDVEVHHYYALNKE